ncbi:hypothetical protein CLPU_26c00120 [Gottschalkia purinilytica]|uniref:Uncharacterized protein n=1 Tax=Gottschalkia purinilytica TaxID=1503 RepID=A0A0L0W6H6_GOTPU|nr:hypothetical protein [Gottschalkia purinilytica]KNF07087.1 hypothetical protein CLPU_26c00120 [Gottschalkia purinilytica]
MKLEVTVCKDIIRKKFDIDDKYNNCRERINKNTLIVSNELLNLWEEDARKNNYEAQFRNWYFSIITSGRKVKKVNIDNVKRTKGAKSEEEKIVIKTAMSSKDKIVVGNVNSELEKRNKKIYFISENIFLKDKKQTINMEDIKNVFRNGRYDSLFDIYETPVRLEVAIDSDSELLGMYLSNFFKNSKNLIINDRYIANKENESNVNKYVLRYVNKDECKITFILPKDKRHKEIENKFMNYNGYKSDVIFQDRKLTHHSSIESDNYIIDLGYRLRVFGDNDDGKTEQEVINITKK